MFALTVSESALYLQIMFSVSASTSLVSSSTDSAMS